MTYLLAVYTTKNCTANVYPDENNTVINNNRYKYATAQPWWIFQLNGKKKKQPVFNWSV